MRTEGWRSLSFFMLGVTSTIAAGFLLEKSPLGTRHAKPAKAAKVETTSAAPAAAPVAVPQAAKVETAASGAQAAAPAAPNKEVLEYGEYLSGECTTCHRKDGADKGIPSIVGWDTNSFAAVMKAFKAGERPNPAMVSVAKNLDDEQITALAVYFASLKPKARAPSTTASAAAAVEPAAATAPADLDNGKAVFNKCRACHQVGASARNGVGPKLHGVVGRKAGSVEGFQASTAMIEAAAKGLVWTEANLDKFLAAPRDFTPGTKMSFSGLRDAGDRRDLIGYLKSQK